ncbi:hypothetical protein AB0C33_29065 [Nonomuraea sp. NPDC048881]|uniref:hypothetical protein n=1 Tax=Nonomuraea sp. NPDC048881 TaxID=3155030 RepID=UPI003411A484
MLRVAMNDSAAGLLGVPGGPALPAPPGGLAPGLRERVAQGLVRRGEVLGWAASTDGAERAPAPFHDLTGWECDRSSVHLEDFVPVEVVTVDHAPVIGDDGQRVLLLHGVALALEVVRLARALHPRGPVRCVVTANETSATFRFHQIRPGESWNAADLDGYAGDKVIVVDRGPFAALQEHPDVPGAAYDS